LVINLLYQPIYFLFRFSSFSRSYGSFNFWHISDYGSIVFNLPNVVFVLALCLISAVIVVVLFVPLRACLTNQGCDCSRHECSAAYCYFCGLLLCRSLMFLCYTHMMCPAANLLMALDRFAGVSHSRPRPWRSMFPSDDFLFICLSTHLHLICQLISCGSLLSPVIWWLLFISLWSFGFCRLLFACCTAACLVLCFLAAHQRLALHVMVCWQFSPSLYLYLTGSEVKSYIRKLKQWASFQACDLVWYHKVVCVGRHFGKTRFLAPMPSNLHPKKLEWTSNANR